ncbi:MAG: Rne/Rng family ribonuclease [Alphaproteobacteria bacterium]|nr:Rne/Rng family ribonuclease [Alphaproteobacteria bacterium]
MTKRMLIDATQPEETRVVVLDGNKLEDVEFETTHRRQIKGNVYLGKVMRVEPSLQACFVDYGGNKHGFMAFGEIHPDYYNVSEEEIAEIEKEVSDIIENKKQAIKERELERERIRQEKAAARAARLAEKARLEAEAIATKESEQNIVESENNIENVAVEEVANVQIENNDATVNQKDNIQKQSENSEVAIIDTKENEQSVENIEPKKNQKKRQIKKRIRKQEEALKEIAAVTEESNNEISQEEPLKVLCEDTGCQDDVVCETCDNIDDNKENVKHDTLDEDFEVEDDDDDIDFELQRKLMCARKLFHRHKIQDVIKEGQIVLVQVVKEERGNKGAALTTYLSLAGRYCVLMPNRIKSGGVSRKITNAADRTRLKGIVRELPLTSDMSIIVRTAGEEKTKTDIVRDYNYLIRTWNKIRLDSLNHKAPCLVYEEGNLIKRALRDIYTKDTSEIIVAGEEAFKLSKDLFRILSPHNLKKIKPYKNDEIPLFQRFQVEGQLDKLHDTTAQLESGGYLVINPTEALVSIDVNSGRATKESDLEETALKTNLEACDEIARQLRMRNLAGLVVIDFIDMEEPANNHAVEKRMKEALKKDRSRIQVGKMSMFGLLELSRQRIHSAFWESNYQTCPHCQGKGIIRTTESSAVYVLRAIEEEGIKNRSSKINVYVPSDIAIYILNQKRKMLADLEQKYKMTVIISADSTIKCVSDFRVERTKLTKEEKSAGNVKTNESCENLPDNDESGCLEEIAESPCSDDENVIEENINTEEKEEKFERRRRRGDRRFGRNRFERRRGRSERRTEENFDQQVKEHQEPIILYDSHDTPDDNNSTDVAKPAKEKSNWWKKLIKG